MSCRWSSLLVAAVRAAISACTVTTLSQPCSQPKNPVALAPTGWDNMSYGLWSCFVLRPLIGRWSMRRWFWAAALVTGLTATQAQAHYIIIRMNIGKNAEDAPSNQSPRGPGMPGIGAPAGPPGLGGRGRGGPAITGIGGAGGAGGGRGQGGAGGAPAGPGIAGPGLGPGVGLPGVGPGMGGGAPRGGQGGSAMGPPAGMGGIGDPRGGPRGAGVGAAGAPAPTEDFDSFEMVVMVAVEMKDPVAHKNEK